MLGHVEVNDAPAMVSEYDENEEDAQAHGRHREEIERDQVPDMVGEERPPGLRRLRTPLRDQARDRAFGHFEAKLQELAMNSWGAPERVRGGHACDQCLDLSVDRRSTFGGPARELGPVLAEAAPCQRRTVSGVTITRGCFQPAQTLASATQKRRSVERSGGRVTIRL